MSFSVSPSFNLSSGISDSSGGIRQRRNSASAEEEPLELTTSSQREVQVEVKSEDFKDQKETDSLPDSKAHLIRRPSYRKILTDLGKASDKMISEDKGDCGSGSESSTSGDDLSSCSQQQQQQPHSTSAVGTSNSASSGGQNHYQISHASSSNSNGLSSLQHHPVDHHSFTMTPNGGGLGQHHHHRGSQPIIQYTQDGQPYFLPLGQNGQPSHSGQQGHHSLSPLHLSHGGLGGLGGLGGQGSTGGMPPSPGGSTGGGEGGGGDGTKKREMRLMKNREAARECRRKKKEYIKCLENRVAVLENQNKALIEELKSLKELYTGKQMIRKGEMS